MQRLGTSWYMTYREGHPVTSWYIHMGKRLPAEGHHQSSNPLSGDVMVILQAEGAQCCETCQHARADIDKAPMV